MTTPWQVPRDWFGETVAVLASGPSMSPAVADAVRGRCRVIAVNNQAIPTLVDGKERPAIAPWADMLYAADVKWWVHHKEAALTFTGEKATIRSVLPFPEVLSLELSINLPYDPRPTHLVSGGNGGYQAVHIAAQRGARRILLCGFDMREVGGKKHWFGDHPDKLNSKQTYRNWINNFAAFAPVLRDLGIDVVNCTPGSALTSFRKAKLEDCINA
jgi:hypothetical protein